MCGNQKIVGDTDVPIGIEPSTGLFGNGRKAGVPAIDVDVVSPDQTGQFTCARALKRRQARRDTGMRQPIILGRAQRWRGGHMIPRSHGADFPDYHKLDPDLECINNGFVKNIETEMTARVKTLGEGDAHP